MKTENSKAKKLDQRIQVKALILILPDDEVKALLDWREKLNPLDVIDPGEAFLARLWDVATKK